MCRLYNLALFVVRMDVGVIIYVLNISFPWRRFTFLDEVMNNVFNHRSIFDEWLIILAWRSDLGRDTDECLYGKTRSGSDTDECLFGVLVAKICACKTLTNVLYHSGVWKLWRKHCRRDFFSWRRLITLDWRPDLGRDTDECFLVDPIWVGTLTNVLLRTVRDESYAGLTTRFGSGHWRMSLGRPDLGRDTDECLITYSGDESFRAMQLI
jgi:hypothetical protein